MKYINNRFLILASNESYYSYNNEVTLIKANLILDISNFELRLNFTKYHIGGGENETKEHLSSYNVGTFLKPKKKLVNSLLKDHALRRCPFYGWVTDYSKSSTLTEVFIDLKTQENLIIRAIKLIRIKKMLNKKMKKK